MKIENPKHLEVKSVGELADSKKAGIAENSLPFVFDILSKQLYSNPIGSIVREITSNCFDSHKEAKVDDPVIIRKVWDKEDKQYYIEFEDFGVGLSPERMESIYMNYFSSTKRESNEQIGGFGLGSKTPLSYSDMFYITTRYEAIEYQYIFHKGENTPTLETLSEEETLERNGTIIRIPIKNTRNYPYDDECHLFEKELKSQLLYFDDVYFEGWNINNEYTIYEGQYFKFRSDIFQEKLMHICIGKVTYPINFNEVKVYNNKLPIGIKFEIGELPVTPSREEIRYTDASKKLIAERIDLAIKEIIEKYDSQNPEISDITEFLKLRNTRPRIIFDEESKHVLFIDKFIQESKYRFSPIVNIGAKKTPKNLFFEWGILGYIYDGKFRESKEDFLDDYIERKCVILEHGEHVSKYAAIYIWETLGKTYIIKRKNIDYNDKYKILGLSTKQLGKARVMSNYSKIMNSIIQTRNIHYSSVKPTDEWIAEYRKSIYTNTNAYLRKAAKKVFIRHYLWGNEGDEVPETDLMNRTGITIYGFREDKDLLQKVADIAKCKASFHKGRRKAIIVIQVSKSVEKIFDENPKAIHCSKFFKTKVFKKIATAHLLHKSLSFYNYTTYSDFIKSFKDKEDKVRYAKEFIAKHRKYDSDYVLPIAKENNAFIPEVAKLVEDLKFDDVEIPKLIRALDLAFPSRRDFLRDEVIEYLKLKKIRLNNIFYLKPKQEENGNPEQQEESTCEESSTETTNDQVEVQATSSEEDRSEHDSD